MGFLFELQKLNTINFTARLRRQKVETFCKNDKFDSKNVINDNY